MKVKRPNAVIYFIAYVFFYPALKVCFRLKVDRKNLKLPKGPYIVLANHMTMVDFLKVMLPLYPQRLNAVTSQKYFLHSPLHKLLPLMGCIPKNMFDPDIRSVVGMKTVVKRGDKILLFPEGRCSSSNDYVGINKATGKLIKKLGIPVISCYIEGANICIPHWRKGFRFGRTRVTYASLFTEEELKKLTVDDINAAIGKRLSGEEGVSPPNKPFQTFGTKRLTEGLHMVLYWCPKCGREYTMESERNTIRCTACGNSADMDRYAKLIPAPDAIIPDNSISSWFRDQVRYEMKSLSDDMEPITESVNVWMPAEKPGAGIVECGKGEIRLDPKGWYFSGELSGEQTDLFFPVETIPAMTYEHNTNFQIYSNGFYYTFVPEDVKKCLKYVILAECAHWKFSSRHAMTPGKNSGFVD
jgi:1-acyl-sn-glycerol-3-phosphate acyltransferase